MSAYPHRPERSKRSVATMPKANPQVYLDLSIGKRKVGKITFELFADTVPKAAENFRALCTGEKGHGQKTGELLCLKNTRIYRIIRGFVAQGGDLDKRNGLVGESIYGGTFIDENFERKHDECGLLSMTNTGPHSNGSHFFITLSPLPKLDGKYVVFGKAVKGIELLDELEAVSADNGKPSDEVLIYNCGEVDKDKLPGINGEVDSHLSDSSYENSNADHRKRSPAKDKHTQREKKKRRRNSDYSSDHKSSSGHGRKRRRSQRKKDKSSKSRKHEGSKSEGSRRRHRRNRTSSSDDSGDTR